ncbi:ABC transporter permease [Halorientalis regularis]|jgi:spermidine/putrescine transport system permease protein|uniref:Spermidine/putrescine transport system permease protein n=1 Tax=Halorientalis regularis TaxID=660518 RepID=A0A1G7GGG0_9EURY|nr:ABC transporter permease [Halorientalis regularis]SDE87099.1 spermidine/putrescine transport system permease protein [Halorientalis regularis]
MSTGTGRLSVPALPERWRTLLLLLPVLLLDIGAFLVPMGYLLRLSVTARTSQGAFVEGSWSIDGYRYVASSDLVHQIFAFTVSFGVGVTLLAVAIGVVYAYAAWQAGRAGRIALLSVAVLSLFTTLVIKLFAVVLVFAPQGVLNDLLTGVGLLSEPVLLVDNLVGAVLGQLYIVTPYAILAVYAVLSTLDRHQVEAARDLGAGRWDAFREVILPHIRPGIAVATVVSFTWSIGAYAAPLLLGSGSEQTTGILISELLLTQFDWPAAAALAVITVTLVFSILMVILWRFDESGGILNA